MDSVKIGERSLAVTRPSDLDAKLVSTTGCNVEEHAAMLRHVATPYGVAQALWPLLSDPGDLTVTSLAEAIAEEDVGAAAYAVANLLAPPAPPPAPEEPAVG